MFQVLPLLNFMLYLLPLRNFFHASSNAYPTAKRGGGRGNTASYKRPRVMGMGVFQAENGFKALNPSMSSNKIYCTGTTKITRSANVIGDIGYKPSANSKLKWHGKPAMTIRKLEEMRGQQKLKKGPSSSANPSKNSTSSQSKEPWKI